MIDFKLDWVRLGKIFVAEVQHTSSLKAVETILSNLLVIAQVPTTQASSQNSSSALGSRGWPLDYRYEDLGSYTTEKSCSIKRT